MSEPKVCPVCGAEGLQPVIRKRLSPNWIADAEDGPGVLAYRCKNGHIFLIEQEKADPAAAD